MNYLIYFDMTNEQKAQQIMGCNRANCLECGGSLSVANGCTEFERIMAMARWKDKEWAERFKNAFQGLWTASLSVEDFSNKTETTIEFKLVSRE